MNNQELQADILLSVDVSLQQVDEQLRAKPLQVKELVQEELAEPIQAAVESCRKLDQQMKSLLQRLDHKIGRMVISVIKYAVHEPPRSIPRNRLPLTSRRWEAGRRQMSFS